VIGPRKDLHERASDKGWLAIGVRGFAMVWDFIDEKDIDKHCLSWATFGVTIWIIRWATTFVAAHPTMSGIEIAAIIGAVMLPWTPMQAAVINWYFKRQNEK